MFRWLDHRLGHYLLLTLVWAVLCLPNLGGPALWDQDEGLNSQAAQEMYASGNWIVPRFNYQLRTAKPAFLYWVQVAAYRTFGINEFSARLPSALAAFLTLLVTYELARRMFDARVGLLTGLILASSLLFCGAAHFANPDALLVLFCTAALAMFWYDYSGGPPFWYFLTGAFMGLAVLVKGPVGVVLPVAAIGLFLLWRWQPGRFFERKVLASSLAFCVVALPWYIWVGLATKGQWLYGFFKKHHADRVFTSLENHGGPLVYYLLILFVGLAPWSAFLVGSLWNAIQQIRRPGPASPEADAADVDVDGGPRSAMQFLLCWVLAFFVPFSLVQTKLPNYILPLYPAMAVVLAWFLERWRRGLVHPPRWILVGGLGGLALAGVAGTGAVLVASGIVELPVLSGHRLPGFERWAFLGGVLALGGLVGLVLVRHRRGATVATILVTALLFTGVVGFGVVNTIDRYRAPRPLANALPEDQLQQESRIAAFEYFQPSLVFYCKREVLVLGNEHQAAEFLRTPLPCYLFVPAQRWEELKDQVRGSCRLLGRHHDMLRGEDIVVVTNR
jgi:4-amino-4-deoxy-L-arabinose transferase-like glycosyltransferase